MIRRIITVVALASLTALGWVGTASAVDGHYPADPWQVRDVVCDPYPACTWSDASQSEVTGPNSVDLTKPAGNVGTSIETTDLGVTVGEATTLTVTYQVLEGASTDAGAVRMFWYDQADKDTLVDAPTESAVAGGTSGVLSLTIPANTTIGTMGLTYDASNEGSEDNAGTIRFTGLAVGQAPIWLDQEVTPTEPPATPTPSPTVDPTGPPASSTPSAAPTLPKTSGLRLLPALIIVGFVLTGVGAAAYYGTRRKPDSTP